MDKREEKSGTEGRRVEEREEESGVDRGEWGRGRRREEKKEDEKRGKGEVQE